MTDNNPPWTHPAVFFITRLLILLGMALVFGSGATFIGLITCGPLFGVDLLASSNAMNELHRPEVVNALRYVQGFSAIGMFAIPAWNFARVLQRMPAEYLKLDRKTHFPEIVMALAIVVSVSPFINWLGILNEQMQLPASMADIEAGMRRAEDTAAAFTKAFLSTESVGGLLANILVVGIIAAVGEELMFRGALQNFIRSTTGRKHLSVIVTAVVFSAIHWQFYGFVPRFVLGLVLGYVYLFTGNLWISIFIHFANNTLAVLASYKPFAAQLPPVLQPDYVIEEWYINAASAVVALGLLLLLRKYTSKRVWYNGE